LDADIAIVGAGAAGLSLAWHLVERGIEQRIVLLEPRRSYARDRTFCFWSGQRHPFEGLASHRWPRWRVRASGPWIVRGARGVTYEHLPADAFYAHALDRLESASRVELRLGVKAQELHEDGGGVDIETDCGRVRAGIVFDSRPARRHERGEITLLQHFEGWHVRVDRDVFDPDTATLMDFAVPRDYGIHFFYVLPYGAREALVEATWFGSRVLGDDTYRAALERYLKETLGLGEWDVIHRERGVIPMSTAAPPIRMGRRTYRIGLAGGMAKPSTGYAFRSIQRFSAEMAARLARNPRPEPPSPRAWRARALDRIFLSYLHRYPERAPDTFAALFERVDPALLVRFLGDAASASDCVQVMRALPFAPLTLETLRSAPLWLRRDR
jgi:lycopene beta-cyclase